ncbi:MAG: DUF1624 domain-containing protein [Bdellovibrionaceae bacterium]|nr:DUF1624 domain-containing protein [Pseudobdellovibrionaceae bacterium]
MAKRTSYASREATSAKPASERFDRLDALRGLAIVWMTVFHFCFDLNYFGYLNFNFYEDSLWIYQRTCIVSLFLFCAACGQAVALDRHLSWERFFKRWRMVVGAAVLVTIGSYIVYPNSFIYFGILHGIALMLLILRLTSKWSRYYLPVGLVLIGLKFGAPWLHTLDPNFEVLNSGWLNWLGLVSRKPITEDYVPLIPWLGVLLVGFAAGRWILANAKSFFAGELKSHFQWLAVLGQWSLSYYLVHQPVLFGVVMLAKKITG